MPCRSSGRRTRFRSPSAERGAERCLSHLGLENGHAARDIRELRDLLEAWREARHTAWQTIIKVATTGLLAVIPKSLIADYNKTAHELRLTNGSLIKGIPASEPERFRGPQFHGGWLDELCA